MTWGNAMYSAAYTSKTNENAMIPLMHMPRTGIFCTFAAKKRQDGGEAKEGEDETRRIESKNRAKKREAEPKHKNGTAARKNQNRYSLKSAAANALPHCFTGNNAVSMAERLFYYTVHQGIR